MKHDTLIVRDADWIKDNFAIKIIRREVFIIEQSVPEELEWDTDDDTAIHSIAIFNGIPIATGRLQNNGQLGRMAVLKEYRNKGIGSKVLEHLLRQKSSSPVFIHAQKHAVDFYKRFSFNINGSEFIEAGIPHYIMTINKDKKK